MKEELVITEKKREETEQASYCPKCGERVSSEMKLCPRCGASLVGTARPSTYRIRERPPKELDVLGFVSAGVVLIIVALTYIWSPIEPSVVVDYFKSMGSQRTFIKPPSILLDTAILFFYAVGVWGMVLSALRIILQRSVMKALGDLIGGFFSFFLAFLLTNYAADVFSGRTTLAYFVIAIGLLVIVNATIYFAFPKRSDRTKEGMRFLKRPNRESEVCKSSLKGFFEMV